MADIELVIKIPDHLYKLLKEFPSDSNESTIENVLTKAVENGAPLSKGHWVYTPQRRMVDETDDGCVYETDYKCSCSECGGDFGFARVEDSFCKYCGADMREDKE